MTTNKHDDKECDCPLCTGEAILLTGNAAKAFMAMQALMSQSNSMGFNQLALAKSLGWTEAETVEALHELEKHGLVGRNPKYAEKAN